jgi:hypothetical protein
MIVVTKQDTLVAKTCLLIRGNRVAAVGMFIIGGLSCIAAKFFISNDGYRGGAYILAVWAVLSATCFFLAGMAHKECASVRHLAQRFAVGMFVLPVVIWVIGAAPPWWAPALVIIALTLLLSGADFLRRIRRALTRR